MRGACKLDKIQLQNIRSLKDTGVVSLSPITLLVGVNSSGKSTFLRTFPLIKQSICKRTDGPILWAGDVDDYVDFGSFSETVINDGSDAITLQFEFPLTIESNPRRDPFYTLFEISENKGAQKVEYRVKYGITIAQQDGREYISRLRVYLNDTEIELELSANGSKLQKDNIIRVDKVSISIPESSGKPSSQLYWNRTFIANSIFGVGLPNITMLNEILMQDFLPAAPKTTPAERFFDMREIEVQGALIFIGEKLCQGFSLNELVNDVSDTTQDSLTAKKKKKSQNKSTYATIVLKILEAPEEKRKFYISTLKLFAFYDCFQAIDDYLNTYFRQVHYIAPLRATAERYYRLRNLAIDEVDYQGKNLAIFLNGLNKSGLTDFQNWTRNHFGFKVLVDKSGGHLSVKIELGNNKKSFNLSDTGFGYSQILPIITQLWYLSTRKRSSKNKQIPLVIAIEQPELHLHPAIQAKLADAFIASIHLAEKHGYQLQLLIETHSQTIVNRFGRAISKGEIQPKDAAVVLFDKEMESNETIVRTSHYDADGYLQNWPIGFFVPEE